MRVLTLLLIAVGSMALVGAHVVQTHTPGDARFVGTWRLVSIEPTDLATRGAHPTGLIYYDATGHMAAQIAPDRERSSWPPNRTPTPQQALDAVTGYIAYFGTYTINDAAHTVTHHRQGALNLSTVDFVRQFEFLGSDRIVLMPLERENQGIRLVWERVH